MHDDPGQPSGDVPHQDAVGTAELPAAAGGGQGDVARRGTGHTNARARPESAEGRTVLR